MVRTPLGLLPSSSHPAVTVVAREGGNRPSTLAGVLRPLHRSDFVSHSATLPRSCPVPSHVLSASGYPVLPTLSRMVEALGLLDCRGSGRASVSLQRQEEENRDGD